MTILETQHNIPLTSALSSSQLGSQPDEMAATARSAALRVVMSGAYEILGSNGHALYMRGERQNFSAAWSMLAALAETYGPAGGSGLALRIGRSSFRYLLKEMGEQAGFRDMSFRMLPSPRRVEGGLRKLACLFTQVIGAPAQLVEQESAWTLSLPFRAPVDEAGPMFHWLITGLLQEFCSWAGGGRFYRVSPGELAAAHCVFSVEKKPLD